MWKGTLGQKGFNPFDTLAVAWVTHPDLMETMKVHAWIEEGPDDTLSGDAESKPYKEYLLVREDIGSMRNILYSYRPKPELKAIILERLAARAGR